MKKMIALKKISAFMLVFTMLFGIVVHAAAQAEPLAQSEYMSVGNSITYNDGTYSGFTATDQLYSTDPVNVNEVIARFTLDELPGSDSKLICGFLNKYPGMDGTPERFVFNSTNGSVVSNLVTVVAKAENRLTIEFKSTTASQHPTNKKYLLHNNLEYTRELRLGENESFAGKTITVTNTWNGTNFVTSIFVEDADFYLSEYKDPTTMTKQVDSRISIDVPSEEATDTWKNIKLDNFTDGKGYFFLSPGEGATVTMHDVVSFSSPIKTVSASWNEETTVTCNWGENPNLSELKLTVTLQGDTTEDVPVTVDMLEGFNSKAEGRQNASVSWNGYSFELPITVSSRFSKPIKSVAPSWANDYVLTCEIEENPDLSELKLIVTLEDNTTEDVPVTLEMLDGFDSTVEGEKVISVKFDDTYQFDLKINIVATKYASPKADLGEFKAFYRYHPALGERYAAPLREVPDYLSNSNMSFPYKDRDSEKEAVFGDNLNVVRFLGGWKSVANGTGYGTSGVEGENGVAQYDLAYRNDDGVICYRFGEDVPKEENLIKYRLDPYIDNGYTSLRLVLDNIPYCFPTQYKEDDYGQYAKPADMNEWREFITAVCNELVRLYGEDMVNNFSFRLGTEADNLTRITENQADYMELYRVTAKAVRAVLPNAEFGPYNNLNPLYGESKGIGHLQATAQTALNEGLPFDWLSYSVYFKMPNADPDAHVTNFMNFHNQVVGVHEGLTDVPFEIHEWDMITNMKYNSKSIRNVEQGALGGAGTFHLLMNFYEQGLDKLYHWAVQEGFKVGEEDDTKNYWFVSGRHWIFNVWDYAVGADTYELYTTKASDISDDLKVKAVGYFESDDNLDMVILSAYNMDQSKNEDGVITVYLPKTILPDYIDVSSDIQYTVLSNDTDMYSVLKEDLIAENNLNPAYAQNTYENVRGTISDMALDSTAAKEYIVENYDKYLGVLEDSLTLKDYSGTLVDRGEYYTITVNAQSPSITVLTFDTKITDDVELVGDPNVECNVGENPDLEGLYISAKMENGKERKIPLTVDMIEGFDSERVGEQNVKVVWGEKQFDLNITVIDSDTDNEDTIAEEDNHIDEMSDLTQNPQTGDSNPSIWVMLIVALLSGLLCVALVKRYGQRK